MRDAYAQAIMEEHGYMGPAYGGWNRDGLATATANAEYLIACLLAEHRTPGILMDPARTRMRARAWLAVVRSYPPLPLP